MVISFLKTNKKCMELIFATQNDNKLKEIQELIGNSITITSLRSINYIDDIPENHDTIKENAIEKATFIYNLTNKDCFADDTGLETEALNGEPGVKSARYAGDNKNSDNNISLLLDKLESINNRNARFITVIALIINGNLHVFEGIIYGKITHTRKGCNGFGYDPVFVPEGYNKTFAEMTIDEKNKISHRAIAFNKLKNFLFSIK